MYLPGPDGFLLAPDDPLRAAHLRLNDFLVAEEQRNPASAPIDASAWRRLPKRELAEITLAVLRRLWWLTQHDAELDSAHLSRIRLVTLLRILYRIKAQFLEPELVAIIDATTPLLARISPYGPIERVTEYLKNNDLTPELCRAMTRFIQVCAERCLGARRACNLCGRPCTCFSGWTNGSRSIQRGAGANVSAVIFVR